MKEVEVLSVASGNSKKVGLKPEIFEVEPNSHVEYLYIKSYLANHRQGTHKAKQRGEITGSTRKLHRQKGTGGSRKGDIKNPLFKGGGRVFGPLPRDYSLKINKKVKSLARLSALSRKGSSDNVLVIEDITFNGCKTKEFTGMLAKLNIQCNDKGKILLVLSSFKKNVYLASRNLPNVSIVTYDLLNAYFVAVSNKVIFEESALSNLEELVLANNK